ncbi:MAG: helix-turn-helix transcriptional regulator [Sinobacteraceae bacterium]|nr:helix-turn-helix transcriptional regulator [Nevskiaceae bacterium]
MKPQVAAVEPQLRLPPFSDELQELPAPIFFRVEDMPSHSTYPALRHPWGEFIYSFGGITEVKVDNNNLFAPPHSGLWIPPETEHTCFNHRETAHCSLYVSNDLCAAMPDTACALLVSPLVRAVLEHLQDFRLSENRPSESERLLRVLVDQLSICETTESFMPYTDDPRLGPLLQALHDDPADNRTLTELATAFHMSKRTLMRRCETELGMSLTEWRQRLRLVNALPLINSGRSVESVALDLGYATSSAFIAMFRRLMGSSPKEFTSKRRF